MKKAKFAVAATVGIIGIGAMVPLLFTASAGVGNRAAQTAAVAACVYGFPDAIRADATFRVVARATVEIGSQSPAEARVYAPYGLTAEAWAALESAAGSTHVDLAVATDDDQQTLVISEVRRIIDTYWDNYQIAAIPIVWAYGPTQLAVELSADQLAYVERWLDAYARDPAVIDAIAEAGAVSCEGTVVSQASGVCADENDTDTILATIRFMESRDDYTARAQNATASGAYQFVDATWGRYGGYASAWLAPAWVQDAKAREHLASILNSNESRLDLVPVVWYLPAAVRNPALMDVVPTGNVLTPRQYQQRWLDQYSRQALVAGTMASVCASDAAVIGDYALPLPRSVLTAKMLGQPHHYYPAIDLIVPEGITVFAPVSGTVTATHDWGHNWFGQGCTEAQRGGCSTCGIGVTITDSIGYRWTMCHLSKRLVDNGNVVKAGVQVGRVGNTGRSGTPHLHLEIRDSADQQRCPQSLLEALFARALPSTPASLSKDGCVW